MTDYQLLDVCEIKHSMWVQIRFRYDICKISFIISISRMSELKCGKVKLFLQDISVNKLLGRSLNRNLSYPSAVTSV